MQDHFPEAAVRHYRDGALLHQADRYDNAMCHYAFSAECAIKAFNLQFQQVYTPHKRVGHDVVPVWRSMTEYCELLGVLDPRLSLLLGIGAAPDILFQDHPARRYGNDACYTDAELSLCGSFANKLMQQIVAAALDGRLEYMSERGAI